MLLSALFWLACGLSLLLPVALPCSVPSVHPDRAFSASKCITRGSGAGDMGRRSVFGDRGRCGLAGRGASAPRHGSGRSPRRGSGLGPAAGDGFEFFRGIQPGFAFRRFSVGPLGRSRPRVSALPCSSLGVVVRGGGGSGYLGGSGAQGARGQGNACGVVGEWARARGRGGGFGIFLGIQPCCALRRFSALSSACPGSACRACLNSGAGGGGVSGGGLVGSGSIGVDGSQGKLAAGIG